MCIRDRSVGVGLSANGNIPAIYAQGSKMLVFVFSPEGIEVGFMMSASSGLTTGVLGADAMLDISYSPNAQSLRDLEGPGVVVGASAKFKYGGGADIIFSKTDDGRRVITYSVSGGFGAVAGVVPLPPFILPVEVHGGLSYGDVIKTIYKTDRSATDKTQNSGNQHTDSSRKDYLRQGINRLKAKIQILERILKLKQRINTLLGSS